MKKRKKSSSTVINDIETEKFSVKNDAFKEESLNLLYIAIRQLSEVDRAVILLYLDEQSYEDIAEIIGTNANNVGVRITRIKERLKKILDGKIN